MAKRWRKVVAVKRFLKPFLPAIINEKMNDFTDWLYDAWNCVG